MKNLFKRSGNVASAPTSSGQTIATALAKATSNTVQPLQQQELGRHVLADGAGQARREEHGALLTEKADLEEAIKTLRSGIAGLNREGRERLLAAFSEVDAHFQP